PHRLDDLVDPAAAEPGVDLDYARTLRGGLTFNVQNAGTESERLDGTNAQVYEASDRARRVIRGTVQTRFLKARLGRRPVLRHARKNAVAVSEHQVDVELDAVEVVLEEQIVAGSQIDDIGRRKLVTNQ